MARLPPPRNREQCRLVLLPALGSPASSAPRSRGRTETTADLWILAVRAALVAWPLVRAVSDVLSERVTPDAGLAAGLSADLLLGLRFTLGRMKLEALEPGSDAGLPEAGAYRDLHDLGSVTWRTLGDGDVTPLSDRARVLCVTEAVRSWRSRCVFMNRPG